MRSKQDLIFEAAPAWRYQRAAAKLCNDLMGGTAAMRAAGEAYLPMKPQEPADEYSKRLSLACLDNFYQKTIIFYLGQVFKKELDYQDAQSGQEGQAKEPYDNGWFERFQENVDRSGGNLTVFGKRVFQAGLVDGVTFVLVDYTSVETAVEEGSGRLLYMDKESGEWRPKTQAADERLGQRPYLIHVKAESVLDAWADIEDGQLVVKHFRYVESIELPKDDDGLERDAVKQVIAWWPRKWEKWRERNGVKEMVDHGTNSLGRVPVAWFMPGEPKGGLTARPPLDDLAELNRAYWIASSDHDSRLMPFVRSPAAFARCLGLAEGKEVKFGPSTLIASESEKADLKSIGVDSASAVNSRADLDDKREAMRDYGLQTVQSGVTATMSENVATNASSSLKGWCADFKDCLENAHKLAAAYMGWEDGPAVLVNTEFKNTLDLTLLSHLLQAVTSKVIQPEYYVSQVLSMMPYSDEWNVDNVVNPEFGKEDEYSFPGILSGSSGKTVDAALDGEASRASGRPDDAAKSRS